MHWGLTAPMQQYYVRNPFQRKDVAGPFAETEQGSKYILVAIECFSKWVETYALSNQGAASVARSFEKD